MSSTTERFIRLYEDLVAEVNRRAGAHASYSFEIEHAACRDSTVRKQERLLKYVRDVRHAIQHPKHQSPGHAVSISDHFFAEIESLLTHFRNPPTSSSVGVPRAQIKTGSFADRLGELADEMKRGGFSHIPIVDHADVVIGVFNEAAVFDHLLSEHETIIERGMLVSDILPHCRLDANHTETFRFVPPRMPLDELVDLFSAITSPTTRVGAAFVTASGKAGESLQRMITPWDVLQPQRDG